MARKDRDKQSGAHRAKANLPSKVCAGCGRPFSWRKKWERCWDEVRFCSDRCRRDRRSGPATSG